MDSPTKADLRTEAGCWKIQAAYSALTMRQIGKVLGITHGFISKQFGRYGIRESKRAEATPLDERTAAELLSGRGYSVCRARHRIQGSSVSIPLARGEEIAVGVLSCTHLGCKHQQLSHLHTAYKIFKDEGVRYVFHCGDLVAGHNVYKGQEFDLHVHGLGGQRKYAIENYPCQPGIETAFLDGNHGQSFYKGAGAHIGEDIADKRADMKFLGVFTANISIGRMIVRLHHGKGATSQTKGLKLQRLMEAIPDEEKPFLYVVGHWHQAFYLPSHRGMEGIEAGCLQSRTDLLANLELVPQIGFWIIRIRQPVKGGPTREIDCKWVSFPAKENDY